MAVAARVSVDAEDADTAAGYRLLVACMIRQAIADVRGTSARRYGRRYASALAFLAPEHPLFAAYCDVAGLDPEVTAAACRRRAHTGVQGR